MFFYTSDIHFFDEKILQVCERPFFSVEEMNRIYGHIHNKELSDIKEYYKNKKAYNVGCDICGFKPVCLNEILKKDNLKSII